MNNMKTISNEVAKILSVSVRSKIDKFYESKAKSEIDKVKASKDFVELKKLQAEKRKAQDAYHKAERKLQAKFNVSVSNYSGRTTVNAQKKYSPSTNELKTEIIVANQIDGIEPSKVVDYVVKKHTK